MKINGSVMKKREMRKRRGYGGILQREPLRIGFVGLWKREGGEEKGPVVVTIR